MLPSRAIERQSFNLGWSFPGLSLPDKIRAAGEAGFHHVEVHAPYEWTIGELRQAARDAGVDFTSINTSLGGSGRLGLAAIEGQEAEFVSGVEQAIGYAAALGAPMIHVLSGLATDDDGNAQRVVDNFRRAADLASEHGLTLLMEPLNPHDNPGYFLNRTARALDLIDRIGKANVRLMLDCYHVGRMEADPLAVIRDAAPLAAHVQIAAVPSHAEPDEGTLDYRAVFDLLDEAGYAGRIGAEYVPRGQTADGFGWIEWLGIERGAR